MQRLKTKFLLVTFFGAGFVAALLIGVGALTDRPTLSAVAASVASSIGLLALALVLLMQRRVRADLRAAKKQTREMRRALTPEPRPDNDPAAERDVLVQQIRSAVAAALDTERDVLVPQIGSTVAAALKTERDVLVSQIRSVDTAALEAERDILRDFLAVEVAHVGDRLRGDINIAGLANAERTVEQSTAAIRQFAGQTSAAHSLYARHRPAASVRRQSVSGPTSRQTIEFLDVMDATAAKSVIGFSLDEAAVWAGYEAAASGAHLTAIVADAVTADYTNLQMAQHQLTERVTVVHAPLRPVEVAYVYQPWHDLSGLPGHSAEFDVVLAVPGPDGPRALLPLLPLLARRLTPGAALALATGPTQDTRQLLGVWEANHGARLDEAWSSADVTVVRLP